jgi:SAM-dependent methyltransferase
MNIELGCGGYKNIGFKGLDIRPGPGVDIVCDLEEKLPLPDNSVDLVAASHILEHIRNLTQLMDELYRVCKPGAELAICVPHYKSMGAFQDPTHVRAFTEVTFHYWDPAMPLYKTYNFPSTFKIVSQAWTPLGNLEVILKVLKDDASEIDTQKEALRHEGIGKEVKVKSSRTKATNKKGKGKSNRACRKNKRVKAA